MSIGLILGGLGVSFIAGTIDSASGTNIGLAVPGAVSVGAAVAEQREYAIEAVSGGVVTANPVRAGLMSAGATYVAYIGGRAVGVLYQAIACPEIADTLNNLI